MTEQFSIREQQFLSCLEQLNQKLSQLSYQTHGTFQSSSSLEKISAAVAEGENDVREAEDCVPSHIITCVCELAPKHGRRAAGTGAAGNKNRAAAPGAKVPGRSGCRQGPALPGAFEGRSRLPA